MERAVEPERPDTLTSHYNMAIGYWIPGKVTAADKLQGGSCAGILGLHVALIHCLVALMGLAVWGFRQ